MAVVIFSDRLELRVSSFALESRDETFPDKTTDSAPIDTTTPIIIPSTSFLFRL